MWSLSHLTKNHIFGSKQSSGRRHNCPAAFWGNRRYCESQIARAPVDIWHSARAEGEQATWSLLRLCHTGCATHRVYVAISTRTQSMTPPAWNSLRHVSAAGEEAARWIQLSWSLRWVSDVSLWKASIKNGSFTKRGGWRVSHVSNLTRTRVTRQADE